MAIDKEEIARVAHLARLELAEEAADRTAEELSRILDFVGQMSTVDTTGVTPMAHPLDATQRLRGDQITETDRREELQACAPEVEDGLYLVPRVVE